MCGRFGLTDPKQLERRGLLDAVQPDAVGDDVPDLFVPRFNIAPTQPVVAARTRVRDGAPERRVDVLRWGLVPSWAKDPKIGNSLANARAETVTEKPSFRSAWKAGRRCLVFADCFYEWQDLGDAEADPRNGDPGTTGRRPVARTPKPPKQPYAIRLQEDAPFCFAGLWEAWRDPARAPDEAEAWVPTCTLITTSPNSLMATIIGSSAGRTSAPACRLKRRRDRPRADPGRAAPARRGPVRRRRRASARVPGAPAAG